MSADAQPRPRTADSELTQAEMLGALFTHAPTGLFVLGADLHVVLFNPAAAELTGWGEDTADVPASFDPVDAVGRETLLHLKAELRRGAELTDRRGRRRAVEIVCQPVRGDDGSLRFIMGRLRDVEAHRDLEDQLIQSKKLASLGTLVAGIAHELRNPLGIIRSAAQIVANEERTSLQRREAMRLVLEETARLDKLVREFLDFARPNPPRSEPTDIAAHARSVAEIHAGQSPSERFEITVDSEEGLPLVPVDQDQMRLVFDNLISNAEAARADSDDPVHLRITARTGEERCVRLEFADDGNGIAPADLPRVFDPFFTTRRGGTGLGLSIVHQIITQHRGWIGVDSRPGEGTVFTIHLPAAEERTL